MRVLVLGASGMVGNMMIRALSSKQDWEVFGTVRSSAVKRFFPPKIAESLETGIDVENQDNLVKVFSQIRPDVVINCVGLIKKETIAEDPSSAISINALLPHRLASLCAVGRARLIHISTDCVFSGEKGGYSETDPSDAKDLYGRSKFLGEVHYAHSITLRTSFIGHELQSAYSLLEWFLSQRDRCKGFSRAIFSGVPTVVLAQLIRDVVIPRTDLFGVYHVASRPIAKYDLLQIIEEVYGKSIDIVPSDDLVIDRSLNADRFLKETGYSPPDWPELIKVMYSNK